MKPLSDLLFHSLAVRAPGLIKDGTRGVAQGAA